MTCLNLGANPALFDVLSCGILEGMGGWMIAAIVMFVLLFYGMYKARVPFIAMVPIGLMVLFVFAGAGSVDAKLSAGDVFTSMMWIAVVMVGAVILLAFWKLRRPF